MARLIDADKLPIRKAYCIDESGFGATFYVVDKSDIDNAPTVYDLDKVVDEFAERVNKTSYDMEYNGLTGDVLIRTWASTIDEIAEELKGGVSDD